MVAVVSSNPTGGNYIFCWNFSKTSVSILYRNARFVLNTKTPTLQATSQQHDPVFAETRGALITLTTPHWDCDTSLVGLDSSLSFVRESSPSDEFKSSTLNEMGEGMAE